MKKLIIGILALAAVLTYMTVAFGEEPQKDPGQSTDKVLQAAPQPTLEDLQKKADALQAEFMSVQAVRSKLLDILLDRLKLIQAEYARVQQQIQAQSDKNKPTIKKQDKANR